jgi:excisionase family DNA binding protein
MLGERHIERNGSLAPRGLSVQAAAEYCGVRAWAISEAVYDGRLAARRLGRSLVILKDDLDRFLSSLPTVEPSSAPSIEQRKKRRLKGEVA